MNIIKTLAIFFLAIFTHAQPSIHEYLKVFDSKPLNSGSDHYQIENTEFPKLFITSSSSERLVRMNVYQEEGSYFHEYTYDSLGNLASDYCQGGTVRNSYKYYYKYDTDRNLISDIFMGGSPLKNVAHAIYSYDSLGNRILSEHNNWENGEWIAYYRVYYAYDNSGNKVSQTPVDLVNDQWVNLSRETYTYDSNNYRISRIRQKWGDEDWKEPYSRSLYTNDSSGNMILAISEGLIGTVWEIQGRSIYTYNEQNRLTSDNAQNWIGHWVNSYISMYTYDSNQNLIERIFKKWEYNGWINLSKRSCFYLDSGNLDYATNENWVDNDWVAKNGSIFIDDSLGNRRFYSGVKITAEYESLSGIENTIIHEETFNLSQNYPNPFNPSTIIKYSIPHRSFVQIRVYDVLGREVSSLINDQKSKGEHAVEFNAKNIPSGVYFYQLQSSPLTSLPNDKGSTKVNFMQTKKMIFLK